MALWHNHEKATFTTLNRDVYLLFDGVGVKSPYVSTIALDGCSQDADFWVGTQEHSKYNFYRLPKRARKVFKNLDLAWGKHPDFEIDAYFADIGRPENGISDIFRLKGDSILFAWFGHSVGVAVHLAVWLGFEKLHFVGVNAGGYDDYTTRTFLNEFARLGSENGIDCISCTKGSALNGFMEYMPLDEALTKSKKEW